MTMKDTARRLLTALAALLLTQAAHGANIPKAAAAPKPLSPQESAKHFRLPDGFHSEPVAAEPQVIEPTGMCFDARGRIFVCELHGYNLDGYYDIVELNKTGRLDTAVRRIPATKAAEERAARETYGTVKLLEDTDGDGRVDKMTVFAPPVDRQPVAARAARAASGCSSCSPPGGANRRGRRGGSPGCRQKRRGACRQRPRLSGTGDRTPPGPSLRRSTAEVPGGRG